MALGAIVVLTTSTLNRLMVVELSLPAVLPGLLVSLHYGFRSRARIGGSLSDKVRKPHALDHRGMVILGAVGGVLAARAWSSGTSYWLGSAACLSGVCC